MDLLGDLEDDAWGQESLPNKDQSEEKEKEKEKPKILQDNKILDIFDGLSNLEKPKPVVDNDPLGFIELLSGAKSNQNSPDK